MHFSITELLTSHTMISRDSVADKRTVKGKYEMVAQLLFFFFNALDFQSRKLDLNLMNCKCLSVMSSNLGDNLNFGNDLTF